MSLASREVPSVLATEAMAVLFDATISCGARRMSEEIHLRAHLNCIEFAIIAQMENSDAATGEIPAKKPRKPYVRRKIAEPLVPNPIPQAPNPQISALEADIYELVKQRSQAQAAISHWNRQLQAAQNGLRGAQEEFARLEGEVNYRMQLIAQMRGGSPGGAPQSPYWHGQPPVAVFVPPAELPWTTAPPQSPTYQPAAPYPQYPPPFDPRSVPPVGIGSAPAPNVGLYPDLVAGPDGAQTGNADAIRQQEMRLRGY